MSSVVTWIVEEKNPETGASFTASFTDYNSALDVYNDLKLRNESSQISITKSEKKFLIEG